MTWAASVGSQCTTCSFIDVGIAGMQAQFGFGDEGNPDEEFVIVRREVFDGVQRAVRVSYADWTLDWHYILQPKRFQIPMSANGGLEG